MLLTVEGEMTTGIQKLIERFVRSVGKIEVAGE